MTRRLYLQLYLAFLAVALGCLVAGGIALRLVRETPPPGGPPFRRAMGELLERSLPPADGAPAELERRLRVLADQLELDLVVWDAGGAVVAATTTDIPPLSPAHARPPRFPFARRALGGHGMPVRLADGRRISLRARDAGGDGNPGETALTWLAVVALTMAVGLYPVARWITRRVERLDRAVKRWGQGELAQRAEVEGRDEIATLARSFNRAAEQVEALLGQQRLMLANASHELRSPLARLRMAIELAEDAAADPAERRRRLEAAVEEIGDLDALVDHVLVMARADPRAPHEPLRPVALDALVAEEAARTGARVVAAAGAAEPIVDGDRALLRHLVRNLLENARQYGGGAADSVDVQVSGTAAAATIAVEDRGPGVPEAERDQIFVPFFRGARARAEGSPGTGLGLALVRQVARFHGGDVVFEPRSGGGSRFVVTLPRAGAPQAGP